MNIFVTSTSPVQSARYLDDKHVIKMILESAQMLSTAIRTCGYADRRLYRATHANHPCSVWVRESRGNYEWLLAHFKALCAEYTRRYGRVHKSQGLTGAFDAYRTKMPLGKSKGRRTPFANCAANNGLNLDFKHIKPVTKAYKEYLKARNALAARNARKVGSRIRRA